MRVLICLLCLGLSAPVAAEIYRYVDANGVVHYTDKPPRKDAQPIELPPLQSSGEGVMPQLSAPPPKVERPVFRLSVTSPSPDETFRDPSGVVNFSVSILPGLVSGYGLVYYLDGVAQNPEPTPQTRFTYAGLERGSHVLAAALIGPDGREVARSEALTVHLKPPIARN